MNLETLLEERKILQKKIEELEKLDGELYLKQIELQKSSQKKEDSTETNNIKILPEPELNDTPPFWGTDKVALVSYPRSGNSLLRKIIEKLTNTITGSDARPDRPLVQQLRELGLKGEGVMDSRTWCVKTHFPERVGRAKLKVSRAILIVRNPFDSILSFFQMMLTSSHVNSVSKDEIKFRFGELWKDFLFEEVSIWSQFHAHWLAVKIPLLIVRYEDLIQHREGEISRIAEFLYAPFEKFVQNGEIKDKIASLVKVPTSQLGIYPPKSNGTVNEEEEGKNVTMAKDAAVSLTTKEEEKKQIKPFRNPHLYLTPGYVKSLDYYSNEQYRYVLATLRSDLCKFGYWEGCVTARPQQAPDLVAFVDFPVGTCLHEEPNNEWLHLNSFYSVRPRLPCDPYGRGFDLRWEQRLNALPTPDIIEASTTKNSNST